YLLLKDKNYREAIVTLGKVLPITDSPLLQEKTLGNLAESYAGLADWKKSIALAEQAEKFAEQIELAADQEVWLIDLGKAHYALWEDSEAERDYLKALSIAQHRDRANTALCFHNLTLLALRRHDVAKAEEYLRQGEALKAE